MCDISIILPTFNRPEWLDESLRSVWQQRHGINYQLILINNGSTDGKTPDVCKKWLKKFSDCVFVSEYDNSFGNIGKSYSKARGRYIVDFTDDDRMLPGHLAALYHEMEKDKSIALAFCPAYCIDSDGKRTGEIKGAFKDPVTFDDMLITQRMVMSATMYRKLAYVKPHEKLTGVCGEWFKYLEIFNAGNRIVALDEPRVELRIHNGSDSYIRGIKENGFAKAHLKAWNHWIKWRGKSMSDERWREMLGILNGLAAGTNDYEKIMAEAIGLMKLDMARRV